MFENKNDNLKKTMDCALDNMQTLMNLTITNLEKLSDINLNYGKTSIEKSKQTFSNMANSKDNQDFYKTFNCFIENLSENNSKCFRDYYELSDKNKEAIVELFNPLYSNNPYTLGLNLSDKFFSNKHMFSDFTESLESKYKEIYSTFYKLFTNYDNSLSNVNSTFENISKVFKEAASNTYETTQKVTTENVNTAKKVATETVSAVLNSAKTAVEEIVKGQSKKTATDKKA